jgi:hypothetical protein
LARQRLQPRQARQQSHIGIDALAARICCRHVCMPGACETAGSRAARIRTAALPHGRLSRRNAPYRPTHSSWDRHAARGHDQASAIRHEGARDDMLAPAPDEAGVSTVASMLSARLRCRGGGGRIATAVLNRFA